MSKVGFIGLGIMGKPMAAQPDARAATSCFVHSRSGVPQELMDGGRDGLRAARKEVAQKADIIITMVPDTPDVEKVLFGENGVAEGLSRGQDRRRHELDLADRDQGVRQAHQRARLRVRRCAGLRRRSRRQGATLTIMVGGARGDFDEGEAAVRADGQEHHAGRRQRRRPDVPRSPTRSSSRSISKRSPKRCCSPSKAGADPAKVRQALMGGFASSRDPRSAWRAHDQAHLRPGLPHRAASEGSEPRAAGARALGVSLPNTATAQELFNACAAHGGKAWDHSAMVRALERMANHEMTS